MKKLSLLLLVIAIVFISCKKDSGGSPSNDALSGTWNFTSMTAHTQSDSKYNISGDLFENISTSDFTTTSAGGTITFSGGNATSTNITYSVSTTVFAQSYEDNVLVDTLTAPFDVTVPSSSSVDKYQIVGADSVIFPAGGFVSSSAISGGATTQTTASRFKFTISGNTLTMTTAFSQDSTETVSGITQQVNEQANYSVSLTKQ
jgi:hypothetical protein